ncbi:MAG: hypothetical protein MR051_05830 [Lentisphaeria bacterium]|nr:hypothetical protein [Lentisphaeria bacterium]
MQKIKYPSVYCADQLLTFSGLDGRTDYATMLTLVSRAERFSYCAVLPHCGGTVRLPDTGAAVVIGNDFADFGSSRMLLADAWNLLIVGDAGIEGFDPSRYTVIRKPGRALVGVNGYCRPELLDADGDALYREKEREFEALRSYPVETDDADTREAAARAWEVLRACIYTPEEKFVGFWATPDRWPHRACWIMDSVYQSIGMRHILPDVAQDMVCALFDHQQPDGRVPMTASPQGVLRAQIQQPVIAMGVKATGIRGPRLRTIYPKLAAYLEWIFRHRDQDGDGMLEWLMGGGYPVCPCGESGMDNSPRFDERNPLAAVDINCLVSRECEIMAEFAAELGLSRDEQRLWNDRHQNLNRLIETYLWNEELGIYCDMDIAEERLLPVSAVSGFLPLICGAASLKRAARMVELINDPAAFGSPYPLPSVSLSDPKFQMDMWRGPVWYIFNYHVAEGLERYGYRADAERIRRKTVEISIRNCREYGGFFEFYDPYGEIPPGRIDRKGPNKQDLGGYHHAVHDYGWSASVFLDMLYKTAGR